MRKAGLPSGRGFFGGAVAPVAGPAVALLGAGAAAFAAGAGVPEGLSAIAVN